MSLPLGAAPTAPRGSSTPAANTSSPSEPAPSSTADAAPPPTPSTSAGRDQHGQGESSVAPQASATPLGPPAARVSTGFLTELLRDSYAEATERLIAILGPRLETIARLTAGLHLSPSIRGDRRMQRRFKTARTLEEVVASVVPQLEDPCDTSEVARLRSQLYSAEAAQTAAEQSRAREGMLRENAELFSREATEELDQAKKEICLQRELEQLSLRNLDEYHAQVELHNELSLRQENRVKAAEESVNRLKRQLQCEQEVFKAAVATSTSQSKRLHRLLSNSDIADDSSSARLRQRNEYVQEQVMQLIQANKVLRDRVKLEEMDPDVLVLVTECS
ncbi:hypothetical protein PHYPSEUDO_007333 [Phytophthora pseudosyringae]|uniref:Uncharacterized protein n=1 Tax=Phytophthora pseudosyringae TaxID=221518 RepID=A0A8T1WJA2_9STRA|nr:hypothetical protein PHYPSEUDO_007333 [Phytophthora pseudosyringae]